MPDQAITPSFKDTKHKIKVGGEEKELTYDELVAAAQKGDDYEKKTREVNEAKKTIETEKARLKEWQEVIDDIEGNPEIGKEMRKVYADLKSGKTARSEVTRDKSLKTIDRLIEETKDSEAREQLRQVRTMIREEVDVEGLVKRLEIAENELAFLRNSTTVNLSDRIESQLSQLKGKLGNDIVSKYEKEIRAGAMKYPSMSADKLFRYYATEEDIEEAYVNLAKTKKAEEQKLKESGSSPGGGSKTEKVVPVKDSRGRTDWSATIQKMKEAGKFTPVG